MGSQAGGSGGGLEPARWARMVSAGETEVQLPQSPASEQRQGGHGGPPAGMGPDSGKDVVIAASPRGRRRKCDQATPTANESPLRATAPAHETQGLSPGSRPGFPPCHGVAAQHPSHETLKPCPYPTGEETEAPTCNPTARFQPGHRNPRPHPRDLPWGPALHPGPA